MKKYAMTQIKPVDVISGVEIIKHTVGLEMVGF